MTCRGIHAGLDEDAFHGLPRIVCVGAGHAMHLMLPTDGAPILLAGDGQEHRGAHVLEAHGGLPLPVLPRAAHNPQVKVVTLTVFPKGAHLLWVWAGGGGGVVTTEGTLSQSPVVTRLAAALTPRALGLSFFPVPLSLSFHSCKMGQHNPQPQYPVGPSQHRFFKHMLTPPQLSGW